MVVQSDAGAVFAVADGRSEESEAARGSARWVVVEVGHEGRGEEAAGGRGDCDDAGGTKESGGDEHPTSSLISLSNVTSLRGSTPYLKKDQSKRVNLF